jgi:hypothetical protein
MTDAATHEPEDDTDRSWAVVVCILCDDAGRLPNGHSCDHDRRAQRARRGANLAARCAESSPQKPRTTPRGACMTTARRKVVAQ